MSYYYTPPNEIMPIILEVLGWLATDQADELNKIWVVQGDDSAMRFARLLLAKQAEKAREKDALELEEALLFLRGCT